MGNADKDVLKLLKIEPSKQSKDYVNNQTQFQLHSLVTEQRHPKTWDLSSVIKQNTEKGLEQILSVDQDISQKIHHLSSEPILLVQASQAVENAILHNKKIYIYGCGATGRLAIQIDSAFWQPFWQGVKSKEKIWHKLTNHLNNIENALSGEITGADRAMVSSLEGFEDLQVIGKLQLDDHHIQKDDVVFAVTEGGETSAVIGTILAAQEQYGNLTKEASNKAKNNLYFIYNNPNEALIPFDRSRVVLESNAITKIALCTGPQAIAGSTRMQATTISTFVIGVILENAIDNILKRYLSPEERAELGFTKDLSISDRLQTFIPVQQAVYKIKNAIGKLTDLESSTYAHNKFATYFADNALATVFIDSTERSPTFNLSPLDTIKEQQRKSWIQVWTTSSNLAEAWHSLLGRQFHGLNYDKYQAVFSQISSDYLREAALKSLKNAGNEQQFLYDFSYGDFNIKHSGPQPGDLGVMALLHHEIDQLSQDKSTCQKWLTLFSAQKANTAIILVTLKSLSPNDQVIQNIIKLAPEALIVELPLDLSYDPMVIRQQIGLKMLLNSHSTAVMAKLGRVVGNAMTSVRPGNLKLIGRATYLIQTHVNDILAKVTWGRGKNISYQEANAVLFDIIDYTKKSHNVEKNPQVALAIIRILEALRTHSFISLEDTKTLLQAKGLEGYLLAIN